MGSHRKLKTLIVGALSLIAISASAVCTAAWFVLEAQPITTGMVTGSPNITVDQANVTGHKIVPQISSATGFVDTDDTTITSKTGVEVTTNNDNQATADVEFNVPSKGVGYYLVKRNGDGTYRFTFYGESYAWKLENLAGTSRYYAEGLTLATTERYMVFKYDFVNHLTNISPLTINNCTVGANATYSESLGGSVIAPLVSGGASAWFTIGNTNDFSFESDFDLASTNIANSSSENHLAGGPNPLKAEYTGATTRETTVYWKDTGSWSITPYIYMIYSNGSNSGLQPMTIVTNSKGNLWCHYNVPTNVKTLIFAHSNGSDWWGQTDDVAVKNWDGCTYNQYQTSSHNDGKWSVTKSHYHDINYTIVYNKNNSGASGTIANQTNVKLYDDTNGVYANDGSGFTRPGYRLSSWNTVAGGTGTTVALGGDISGANALTMVAGASVTLYAQWEKLDDPSTTNVNVKIYDPFGYLGASPYIFAWDDTVSVYPANNGTNGSPSVLLTEQTDSTSGLKYWKGTFSESYNKFLITNVNSFSGKQTLDLSYSDSSSGTKFYVITTDDPTSGDNKSTCYGGAWYTSLRASGTRKVKVYDGVNVLGSTPYIYAWTSSSGVYPENTDSGAGSHIAMTSETDSASGKTIWTANISTTYEHYIVRNSVNFGQKQSAAFHWADSSSGAKIYVITSDDPASGDSGTTTYGGQWYTALASETKNTYYFYDNRTTGRWTAPKAYVWTEAAKDANGALYPWRNDNNSIGWAGISMTQLSDAEATEHHVNKIYAWKVTVSSSYTNIIFNDGSGADASTPGIQTINLSTADHDDMWFVLTGSVIPSGSDKNKWAGEWTDQIYGITFRASYFIDGEHSSLSSDILDTITSLKVYNYEPTYIPVSYTTKDDSVNAIHYHFDRDTSVSEWFTDEACTIPYSPIELTGELTLYSKYNTLSSAYKTFYVDSSVWGTTVDVRDGGNTSTYFTTGSTAVSPYLYRITVPSNYVIQLAHDTWAINGAVDVDEAGSTDFLFIENQNIAASKSWKSFESIDIGTAVIEKYESGSWQWVTDMAVGDIEHWNTSTGTPTSDFSNWFVYEKGVQMAVGTKFRVRIIRTENPSHEIIDSGASYGLGTSAYTFDDTSDYVLGSLPYYIKDNSGLKTYGYSGNARFNFYVSYDSGSPKLSVAIVPDFGNGYYIMKYNAASGTNHFMDAVKMNSSSNNMATYSGYFVADTTTKIFIRSYNNAVDKLYTGLNTQSSTAHAHLTGDADGVIGFDEPGHYNISISGESITITEYAGVDDFFKLNPLDTSNVASADAIKKQRTTFILEVPFSTTNAYASKASLHVSNSLSAFVGVALYVTGTKLNPNTNLYSTLTANSFYNTLSTGTTVDDYMDTSVNNTKTFYAYIVIDYLPTVAGTNHAAANYTNFTNESTLGRLLTFRIDSTQRTA